MPTTAELLHHPAVKAYTPWITEKDRFTYQDLSRLWSLSEKIYVSPEAAKMRIRRLGVETIHYGRGVVVRAADLAQAIIDRHNLKHNMFI